MLSSLAKPPVLIGRDDVVADFAEDVAMEAAHASAGYPYMIQLVGYYMWRSAQRRRSQIIEEPDVKRASADARLVFMDSVCAPAYMGLTKAQQLFIDAMAQDLPSPTAIVDVATRCGKSRSWANAYRRSLIDANIIEPVSQGEVAYAIPHFGSYMQHD